MIELARRWIEFSQINELLAAMMAWVLHAAFVVLTAILFIRWSSSRLAALRRHVWIACMAALASLAILTATTFPFELPVRIAERHSVIEPDSQLDPETSDPPGVHLADREFDVSTVEVAANETVPVGLSVARDQLNVPAASWSLPGRPAFRAKIRWAGVFVGIYLLGLAVRVAWIAFSAARLHQVFRRAIPLSIELRQHVQSCMLRLSLKEEPIVAKSSDIASALTWGVIRPVVLLPDSFEEWTEVEQRDCLLHELAHVKHHDGRWNWVAQLVSAIYWFHPLVQLANARLRQACEEAADDVVIQSGVSASSYSASLLAIAERIADQRSALWGTLGAASGIESRIRRVLDGNRPAGVPASWARWTIAFAFAMLASTSLRLQAVAVQPPSKTANQTVQSAEPAQPEPAQPEPAQPEPAQPEPAQPEPAQPAPLTAPALTESINTSLFEQFQAVEIRLPSIDPAKAASLNVTGVVKDKQGPVAGALVIAREFSRFAGVRRQQSPRTYAIRTTTDKEGRFQLQDLPIVKLGQLWEVLAVDSQDRFGFQTTPPIRAFFKPGGTHRVNTNIELSSAETIGGQVLNVDGRPLVNVRVRIATWQRRGVGRTNPFMPIGNDPNDPFAPTYKVHFDRDLVQPVILTDAQGRFSWNIGDGDQLEIDLEQDGFYPRRVIASSGDFKLIDIHEILNEVILIYQGQANQDNIEIHAKYDSKAISAQVDINQMKQVFINLILNSIQAIEKKRQHTYLY